jgi:predicted porin
MSGGLAMPPGWAAGLCGPAACQATQQHRVEERFMVRNTNTAMLAAAVLGALGAGQVQAIGFTQGDWTLDINGTVNAFYVQGEEKWKDAATGASVPTPGGRDRASVQNGLLPGWINFVASTKQKGLDVKAHFGFAPGIDSESPIVGLPGAEGEPFTKIDSRNIYFQFGNANIGTFKFGRDIGLFMQNPILSDMTLLGVGGTVRAAEPFNTSFGMIGHGYMYTGFQPQITYSTPNFGGLQFSAGVFNPSQYSGSEKKTPGFQALGSYEWKGGLSGKVWAAYVNQKTSGSATFNPDDPTEVLRPAGFKADGYEGGVKVGFGPFEVLASAFSATGLGISTVGAQYLGGCARVGTDGSCTERLDSSGYFLQATYTFNDELKLGVNYGENKDDNLTDLGTAKRDAFALGVYYKLTPNVTLVGEYINETGKKILGDNTTPVIDNDAESFSLGAILFF